MKNTDININYGIQESPDPDSLQRIASDPANCAWVTASAGSGKTKVLTDRVLRLLLPSPQKPEGTEPGKILCLTYTKAAANEMAIRINNRLAKWTIISDEELKKDINDKLTGTEPDKHMLTQARKLFAKVLETPGGLKIMTIHSFCQSLLGRFPIEAGISPDFQLVEGSKAKELLNQSISHVIKKALLKPENNATDSKSYELEQALKSIISQQNEEQIYSLLNSLIYEQNQFENIMKSCFGSQGLHTALCKLLEINPADNFESVLNHACEDKNFDYEALQKSIAPLLESTKQTDAQKATTIKKWLNADKEQRITGFSEYSGAYLTTKGELRKQTATAFVYKNHPETAKALENEASRIKEIHDRIAKILCTAQTRDVSIIADEVIKEYSKKKAEKSLLDYNDLIFYALNLLRGENIGYNKNTHHNKHAPPLISWVMYKLDQGIDHILVDEAQDTNPEQWQIIEALCNEFFSGRSAREEANRTLFVVGDIKQSIYSFQRAAPDRFPMMQEMLQKQAVLANASWCNVPLNISFRTVEPILSLVDEVFSTPEMSKSIGEDYRNHISFRKNQGGMAEIWELTENDEEAEKDLWTPPPDPVYAMDSHTKMAINIAKTIKSWIVDGEILESTGKPITAGDIMILVRSRKNIAEKIIRELKNKNIPVSGADRMILGEQPAVQDILSAIEFALLPENDLNLACLLKSPFIGITEEELFDIAYERKSTLWNAVKKHKNNNDDSPWNYTVTWLQKLIDMRGSCTPYEFIENLLGFECPAGYDKEKIHTGSDSIISRLGIESLETIDELQDKAISFENENIPTLQRFIKWMATDGGKSETKREMDEKGNFVRVMTIHGAKGLQAPIVILPDTNIQSSGNNNSKPNFLFPDKTGLELPLFRISNEYAEPEIYAKAKERIKQSEEQESMRLLYVAMTRAEDRLYIGGCKTKRQSKSKNEDTKKKTAYDYIKQAFEKMYENKDVYEKTGITINKDAQTGSIRAYKSHTAKLNETQSGYVNDLEYDTVPAWIYSDAPPEPDLPTPLTPSRPVINDVKIASPLSGNKDSENKYRFKRGNLTHKLLQYLPEVKESDRERLAREFIKKQGTEIPESFHEKILQNVLSIITSPETAHIFKAGSMAEVPITGIVKNDEQNVIISGQIDRLVIEENRITIIDFKTGEKIPENPEQIPLQYKNQMKAYKDIISRIYTKDTGLLTRHERENVQPVHDERITTLRATDVSQVYKGKKIECYLLWTDAPLLMKVNL